MPSEERRVMVWPWLGLISVYTIKLWVACHNKSTMESAGPLCTNMGMVPVHANLVQGELIGKVGIWGNWTMSYLSHFIQGVLTTCWLCQRTARDSVARLLTTVTSRVCPCQARIFGSGTWLLHDCNDRAPFLVCQNRVQKCIDIVIRQIESKLECAVCNYIDGVSVIPSPTSKLLIYGSVLLIHRHGLHVGSE